MLEWDHVAVCVPPPSPLHAGHLLRAEGVQGVFTKNIVYNEV